MLLEIALGDAYGAGFEYADTELVLACNNLSGYLCHPIHKLPLHRLLLARLHRAVLIDYWRVCNHPFSGRTCVAGDVYDHPLHRNGRYAWTSGIEEVNGPLVRTEKRLYVLGDNLDVQLSEQLKADGASYDPTQPLANLDLMRVRMQ